MVVRRLSFHFGLLAMLLASSAGGLLCAQDGVVIISDEFAELNQPIWADEESSDAVHPAQYQSRARSRGTNSRTSTRQAGLSGGGQRNIQTSQLRLANTPKMMGDFYNLPGGMSIVGELFTGDGDHDGLAVHQTAGSDPFANNNIAIIVTDSMTDKTVYLGGPGGITPGTFFLPEIPEEDLENPQTGLMLDGDDVNFYTAVLNGDTTDVYANPSDTSPSISDAPVYQVFQVFEVQLGGPNPGDFVGRVRVQDNNSAMPTDRIFLDYNYFHNVPFTANGIDVNRFTPGVEKTFLDGLGSVEVRVPMAVTFNSNQYLSVGPDTSEPEFGNVTIIPKILLTSNNEMAVAAGMGIALPTADNSEAFGTNGARIISIENESVHLIPFLAFLYTPQGSDCFMQAFVTLDVDLNGNAVNADVGTGNLQQVGVWNDQNLGSGSFAFGKYLYQNYSRTSRVKSFSLLSELHYTGTVNDADTIDSGPFLLGTSGRDLSLLNGTFGGTLRLKDSTVTGGYTVPLTSSDRIFDGEFRLFINQFF